MIRDLISINKKSIIALLLSFVILFSIVIPTVIAAEDISSKSIEEQIEYYKKDLLVYENEREITGDIIDFSNKKIYDFDNGDVTYGDLNVNNYQITKKGHNYTIILNDLTAKKIILPIDDADNKETNGIFGAYSGDPRLTNITIILKGENKITGYGIEGTCVKGVKIVGEGNLTIKAWPEPKVEQSRNLNKATDEQLQNPDSIPVEVKLTKYVVPGIRLETGIEKYQSDTNKYTDYNDDNSLVFASKGNITIESPEYYGITNNGDIAFRSGNIKITSKKSAVSGYRIIVGDENNKNDKNFSIELIAQEQAFFEKPTFVRENLITIASKSNSQNTNLVSKTDIENSYKGYRYIKAFTADEENAPVITNIEENKSYCELPRVTVTDDTAIKNITVNGEEITRFSTDSSILKTFYIPDSSKAEKEIVATDVLGNKTTMKITAHITHQLSAPVKENVVEATCRNDGFYTNTIRAHPGGHDHDL